MDIFESSKYIEYYQNISDEELKELLLQGENNFQEGVYAIIKAEAGRRKIYLEDVMKAKPYSEMMRGELLELLINRKKLDKEAYELVYAEAKIRNILEDEILEFYNTKNKEEKKNADGDETEKYIPLDNPLVLMSAACNEDIKPFEAVLKANSIRYEVNLTVAESDYLKAKELTDNITPGESAPSLIDKTNDNR